MEKRTECPDKKILVLLSQSIVILAFHMESLSPLEIYLLGPNTAILPPLENLGQVR